MHNYSNLILIRFEGIEANYFYIYKKNHLKESYELFFTFHSDTKPLDTKRQMTTLKNKMI
jgi:hypothetical protein